MADPNRNPTAAVSAPPGAEEVLRDPLSHDFFAALRRLQTALPMPPIGSAQRPGEEPVRFGQEASLAFAPTAISGAKWNEKRSRLELKVRFNGMLGPNGAMPAHITEYIIDRQKHHGDHTLGAFLDIFHHRIYSLFFRAWALNQPTADLDREEDSRHSEYFRSLVGTALPGTHGRDSIKETARMFYSGWLGGLGRSPDGLAAILADFLRVPAEVRSFQGTWLNLPQDSCCRLGESPSTGVLGASCFAGSRIWVAHLKFRIRFGPLTWKQYQELLPGGTAFKEVADWVRTYVGEEFEWEAQLVLRRNEVPECKLGQGALLGWTSWLGAPAANRDVDDLIVHPPHH